MKLNKYIYVLSMAGMLGLWSCTSDEAMPDRNVASGERVPITIEVSHGDDAQTRTDLSEDLQEGGLTHTWTAGDELYLYDSTGAEAGKVTLESGEGDSSGIFTGEVTAASGEYCLWYFGSKQSTVSDADFATCYPYVTISNGQVTIDLKKPTFTNVKDFSKVDVMSQMATVNVNGRTASVAEKITMRPHVALARFDLQNLPANVTGTLKLYDTKAKTPEYINTKQTLSLAKGETAKSEETEAYTFTDWSSDKDLYVAFVPYSSNLKFEYTYNKEVQENGSKKIYQIKNIHSFAENQNLVAGTYYQSFKPAEGSQTATVGGVEVPFEIDDSDNPGNTANWGGAGRLIPPKYTDSGDTSKKYRDGGWCINTYSIYTEGGWSDPITYHSNGIVNGALYSTRNASPSYYQWGRWMGFPYYDNMLSLNAYGQSVNYTYATWDNAFALGESIKDNYKIMYQNTGNGSGDIYGGYFAKIVPTVGVSGGWDNERAIRSSIIFAIANSQTSGWQDYLKTNEYCSWEDRAGNPCPDGWRIPKLSELQALIPGEDTDYNEGVTIIESHAEVRYVKGVKYAFCYKVTKNDEGVPCLNIASVKTDKDDVTIDDPIFDKSIVLSIGAYGRMIYTGKRQNYKQIAFVWSSESGSGGGISGNAGAALMIEFEGNMASIYTSIDDRINGSTVIPILDDNAVHTDIRPWFPHFSN